MITIDRCLFINRAPFSEPLEICMKEGVNVLCGINGRGKTTILSYIVDAIYEMARPNYQGSFEGRENRYYRVSSSFHLIDSGKPSIVYIRFLVDERTVDYIDVRGKLTEAEYNHLVKYKGKIDYKRIKNGLASSDTVKTFSCMETDPLIKDLFRKYILTYFPSYRYELPGYLNIPYKGDAEISNLIRYSNELPNLIEVCTGLDKLSGWILDIVLDWEVNKRTQRVQVKDGFVEVDNTPESFVWNSLSMIMKEILVSKQYPGRVRLGIGRRSKSGNRISVMHDTPSGSTELVCPNLSLLSSGEASLLCMFGEIIRQADRLRNNIILNDIQGIVLIDEIEKHLHIRLQKEALPKLLKLFPKVQFIVSSHSPFLNMGLAAEPNLKCHVYDLDNGAIECEPTSNEEYQKTYELFINERNTFAKALSEIRPRVDALTKPLVITEGKTDWKHIKKALDYYKSQNELLDLDYDLVEYDFDFGDSKLDTALKHYSRFTNRYKIIGIFDCDEGTGRAIHKMNGIKDYGNGVFGMAIPVPDYRNYNEGGISIEFLYKNEDLKKQDINGRRLYITSEFDSNGRFKENREVSVKNAREVKDYTEPSREKIHDHDVIDIEGNSLALSKESFANNILYSVAPFDNIDFSGFRAVFDRLKSIIAI